MTVIINGDTIKNSLQASKAVELLEDALRNEAAGTTVVSPKYITDLGSGSVRTLVAGDHRAGYFAIKSYNVIDGVPGARYQVSLYSFADGALVAIMDGRPITDLRTGAASGAAARRIGIKEPVSLGIVGSGHQARAQIRSLSSVLSIGSASVFSPTEANRVAFAKEMGESLGLEIKPVDTLEAAVAGHGVVATASSARTVEPIIRHEWLESCRLLCAVGNTRPQFAEIDVECFERASLVVVDSLHAIQEAGDLIRARQAGALPQDKVATLANLVSGAVSAPRDGLIIFKSVGTALQDLALARYLYENLSNEEGIQVADI